MNQNFSLVVFSYNFCRWEVKTVVLQIVGSHFATFLLSGTSEDCQVKVTALRNFISR